MEKQKFTQAREQAAEVLRKVKGLPFAEAKAAVKADKQFSVTYEEHDLIDFDYKSITMSLYKADDGTARHGRVVEWYDPKGNRVELFDLPHADSIEYRGETYKCAHVQLDDERCYMVADERLNKAIAEAVDRGDAAETHIDEQVAFYAPSEWLDGDDMEMLARLNKELTDNNK